MFWGNKNKSDKDKRKAEGVTSAKSSAPQTREEIQAQAMENVRAARAHIGEETLDRIAEMMTKKQQSAMEQAKRDIQAADPDKVLDELLFTMRQQT